MSADEIKAKQVNSRFLYDRNDLLVALQHIRPANLSERATTEQWGMLCPQLKTPDMFFLQLKFKVGKRKKKWACC